MHKTESHVRSENLYERARRVIPGGVNSPVRAFRAVGGSPLFIARGSGPYIFDVDGNRYIDFVGSWGPLILGHAHPQVLQAISQACRHGTTFGAPCQAEVELAERVVAAYPGLEQVRFVSSGTEATMSAIRLARAATGRDLIVKFSGCYHGHADHLLVAAGSGLATFGTASSAGVPAGFVGATRVLPLDDDQAVRDLLAREGAAIAAVIIEPVPANHGLLLQRKAFLNLLRDETRRHGALLIFDEVISGFRVARGGAAEYYGITPDMATFGKIIGGGMPVGAFGGRRDVMEQLAPLGPVYQAGTLSGNPVAMIAGLTTLDLVSAPGFHQRLGMMTDTLVRRLAAAAAGAGIALFTNHVCGMFGFFFTTERNVDRYEKVMACDVERFKRFFHGMLKEGVYFAPSAFEAGFLSAAHTEADIDATAAAAARVFGSLKD